MPSHARRMIVIGWAIAVAAAVALLAARPNLLAMGKFAGAFTIMLLLVPAVLAVVILLTIGTVTGARALLRHAPFSRLDYLLLAAGASGTAAGLWVAGSVVYLHVRYP